MGKTHVLREERRASWRTANRPAATTYCGQLVHTREDAKEREFGSRESWTTDSTIKHDVYIKFFGVDDPNVCFRIGWDRAELRLSNNPTCKMCERLMKKKKNPPNRKSKKKAKPEINGASGKPIIPVGTEVWLVCRARLIVRCNIVAHEDWRTPKDRNAAVYYYVDEPIGHAVSDSDDIFLTREEAESELLDRAREEIEFRRTHPEEPAFKKDAFLETFRRAAVKFIAGTQDGHYNYKGADNKYDLLGTPPFVYPEREHLVDWFNVEDIERANWQHDRDEYESDPADDDLAVWGPDEK